jgi:hypothetical protein
MEVLYNTVVVFGIPKKLLRLIEMCQNETCSIVHVGGHLSGIFVIKTCLQQGGALSLLLFNFAVWYAIMTVQENKDGLKLKRTHHVFV